MKIFQKVISIILTISLPFLIILSVIRLVLTPVFLEVEYRTPGFPPDQFGFSREDRLIWSKVSLNYLVNDAGIEFLNSQKLPGGEPLYNSRELLHMQDVKILTKAAIAIWYGLGVIFILATVWSLRNRSRKGFWHVIKNGGWLTIGFVFLVLIGVMMSFDALFTGFHRIFFKGDTWLFLYSDTLIRLFPERFWQDVFLVIGGLSVGLALLAIIVSRKFIVKSEK